MLILTKNERVNIADCIASTSWSDDIVVLDSLSDDDTGVIAERCGARVVQRAFDNWSAHQNWAVQHIQFKNEWVFYLDADERCDDQLKNELLDVVASDRGHAAFRVRRKDMFLGRWLKRAQVYPTWIVRVFRPERIRYERLVNPVAVVDGDTGDLQGHLIHHPFSHGVRHWFDRHNSYSDFEACDYLTEVATPVDWRGILSRDVTRRRKALKNLAYRMPLRPWFVFFYLYVLRRGFLDGVAGYYYSSMRASYELMIDAKVREIRWRQATAATAGRASSSQPSHASQEQTI